MSVENLNGHLVSSQLMLCPLHLSKGTHTKCLTQYVPAVGGGEEGGMMKDYVTVIPKLRTIVNTAIVSLLSRCQES